MADGAAPEHGSGWGRVLALVGVVTVLRLAYLVWFCPYGLIEDEAYYWLWSEHPDWSYLTKGPGVAQAIALGTLVLGDAEAGVRLTAPLWGALLAIGVAGLAGRIAGGGHGPDPAADAARVARARWWGAAAALLTPALQALTILMTIDGPMLACMAIGLWAACACVDPGRGDGRASPGAWIALGLSLGVGVLFKPVVLFVLVGLAAAMLGSRGGRALGRGWGVLCGVALLLIAAGFAPMLVWNAQHGWAMARHLGEHLQAEGGDGPTVARRLGWVGEYAGLQVALGGFGLVAGVVGGLRWGRRGSQADAAAAAHSESAQPSRSGRAGSGRSAFRIAIFASLGVYAMYLLVSLSTRVEGNWALGGMPGMLAIGAAWLAGATSRRAWALAVVLRRGLVVIGLASGFGMLRLDWIAAAPRVGHLVPIGRVMSGPAMAAGVRERLERLDAERVGQEGGTGGVGPAFVLTDHYGRAAQMAFYLPGRTVSCTSGTLDGRTTQFDLWAETRLDNAALLGRSAVLLSGKPENWSRGFARIEEVGPIEGDHRQRRVFEGWGYNGFAGLAEGGGADATPIPAGTEALEGGG
ncbi:MAG: glycosyltransferase family 39 protein [Phycisphaerales bacterium]